MDHLARRREQDKTGDGKPNECFGSGEETIDTRHAEFISEGNQPNRQLKFHARSPTSNCYDGAKHNR